MSSPNILLASNSPRRRRFLDWLGLSYRLHPVDIDENKDGNEDAQHYVMRVAQKKAQAAISAIKTGEILLCADTIVADGNELLGKPRSEQEAKSILLRLRARSHRVYSAIVLYNSETKKWHSELSSSSVPMRNYSELEIDRYIASGDPMDKAGAYAIQHPEFHPVDEFKDCYACVMGLPLCHLARALKIFNVSLEANIPSICFQKMGYHCNIYPEILNR